MPTASAPSDTAGLIVLDVAFYYFQIPLAKPLTWSQGTLSLREGLYVKLSSAGGGEGWGECAPLPGRHEESLEDCLSFLEEVLEEPYFDIDTELFSLDQPFFGLIPFDEEEIDFFPPSLLFAFEQALLNFLFQTKAKAISSLPFFKSIEKQSQWLIPVQSLIAEPGKKTPLKIKIDPRRSLAEQVEQVLTIAKGQNFSPENPFRIDAGKAWSTESFLEFQQAMKENQLAEAIDYYEDPFREIEDYLKLKADSPAIALDEDLENFIDFDGNFMPEILDQLKMTRLTAVLKPTTWGLVKAIAIVRSAAAERLTRPLLSIQVVMSNTYDTCLTLQTSALLAVLEAAAAENKESENSHILSTQGLGTLALFRHLEHFHPAYLQNPIPFAIPFVPIIPNALLLKNKINLFEK
jgi:o-succinylbenzoate synthase